VGQQEVAPEISGKSRLCDCPSARGNCWLRALSGRLSLQSIFKKSLHATNMGMSRERLRRVWQRPGSDTAGARVIYLCLFPAHWQVESKNICCSGGCKPAKEKRPQKASSVKCCSTPRARVSSRADQLSVFVSLLAFAVVELPADSWLLLSLLARFPAFLPA